VLQVCEDGMGSGLATLRGFGPRDELIDSCMLSHSVS